MLRKITLLAFLCITVFNAFAQPTRDQLEKQRQDLKKEILQTETLLKQNKELTQQSYVQWQLVTKNVELQDKVVSTINKDLRILDDNIFLIQKDINRYNRILDTLKQEYSKSMVYSYKNRSSYDFLNFIFAADNFNDAVQRIAYLRSYREYRQKQGDNIKRMQEMRQKRIADLGGAKQDKKSTLETKTEELKALEKQQQEKDRIVAELKSQGSKLSKELANKQDRMRKVSGAIAAAIKKAQEEARKAALARAAEEERKRKEEERIELAKRKAEEDRLRKEAELAVKNKTTATPAAAPTPKPAPVVVATPKPAPKKQESVLLNSENIALNSSFERNKGSLPWPVDNGYVMMHYGDNKLPSGRDINIACTAIAASIGSSVKSVFDGTVAAVTPIDDTYAIVIQHGKYFTTYSNIAHPSVATGNAVKTGQQIGKVAADMDGNGTIEFYMSNETSNFNPEGWLRRK